MGDVGGCELSMCRSKLGRRVEVLKCLRRGKAPGPNGILNEIVGGQPPTSTHCSQQPAEPEGSQVQTT